MIPEISKPERHEKAWGYELWIRNFDKYCGKILHFNAGAKFSLHFHVLKEETWYVNGVFDLYFVDTHSAEYVMIHLQKGDTVHLKPGVPHQLVALEEGEIFEVSTQHFENDSYRIAKGDSQ